MFNILPFPRNFSPDEVLTRQNDSMIKRIRQPSMPVTDHHSTNDQLAAKRELPTQLRRYSGISQAQPHIGVSGRDFEEDRENSEGWVRVVHDSLRLGDRDAEDP